MKKLLVAVLLLAGIVCPGQERWHADKYSMFIHFGLYSELGGVWNGTPVTRGYSEQIQAHAGIYSDVYEQVAQRFNPSRFDADSIASLAKSAGMRSVVITAKHHDGFCLFRTATTGFNSWDAAPVPRDFIAELSEACGRAGLRFGLYFSLIDWHDPYGHPISSHNADPSTPEHHALNMAQVRELCSGYGPISELWFDMGSLTPSQSKDLYDLVHTLQPGCMVSGRLGNDCYDFCVMGDNSYPDGTLKTAWQAPASMFDETWGYRSWQERSDPSEKASQKLRSLLGTVSHGGNFLLNIGPKGDGGVVPFEREVLLKIGAWLERNGESVYGTEPFAWPGIDAWGFCTRKGNDIFLTPSRLASDTLVVIKTGGARLLDAVHLDDGRKVDAKVSGGECRVKIAACDAGPMPEVIRLRFDRPVAEPAPAAIPARGAVLTCLNAVPDYSYSCFDYYSNYKSVTAYNWYVSGSGARTMTLMGPADYMGRQVDLTVDSETIRVTLGSDGAFELDKLGNCLVDGSPAPASDAKTPRRGWANVEKTLTAQKECDVAVELSSCSAMALRLGGVEIARHLNPYGCTLRKEQFIVHLLPGENVLSLQSFNNGESAVIPAAIELAPENTACRTVVNLPAPLKPGLHTISVKPSAAPNPHSDIELSSLQITLGHDYLVFGEK